MDESAGRAPVAFAVRMTPILLTTTDPHEQRQVHKVRCMLAAYVSGLPEATQQSSSRLLPAVATPTATLCSQQAPGQHT